VVEPAPAAQAIRSKTRFSFQVAQAWSFLSFDVQHMMGLAWTAKNQMSRDTGI